MDGSIDAQQNASATAGASPAVAEILEDAPFANNLERMNIGDRLHQNLPSARPVAFGDAVTESVGRNETLQNGASNRNFASNVEDPLPYTSNVLSTISPLFARSLKRKAENSGSKESSVLAIPFTAYDQSPSIAFNCCTLGLHGVRVVKDGCATVLRRVLLVLNGGEHAYDLGIGEEVMCTPMCCYKTRSRCWVVDTETGDNGESPNVKVLILRKSFFVQKLDVVRVLPNGSHKPVEVFPAEIWIGDICYVVRQCRGDGKYLYAQERVVGDLGERCVLSHQQSQEGRDIIHGVNATDGFMLPANYKFGKIGKVLLPEAQYGEVYMGPMLAQAPRDSADIAPGIQYSYVPRSETAMKLVRHPNSYLPGALVSWVTVFTEEAGEHIAPRVGPLVYNFGTEIALNTNYLAGHFAKRKENPVREVVLTSLIQQAVQACAEPLQYQHRFLWHTESALTSHNLCIGTAYSSLGSLWDFMEVKNGVSIVLTERRAKHVMRHILQALLFLHRCGLAHQDISTANVVLLNPHGVDFAELNVLGDVGDSAFERLEVALIDFAQARVLQLVEATLPQPQPDSVAFTTPSQAQADPASPTPVLNAYPPLPALEVGASATATAPAPEAPKQTFQTYPVPSTPWGKLSYRPPEMIYDQNVPNAQYCPLALDMWQLGVMMKYMLVGHRHYHLIATAGKSTVEEYERMWHTACREPTGNALWRHAIYTEHHNIVVPKHLFEFIPSQLAFEFLRGLLNTDRSSRLTAEQAASHLWLA